MDYTNYEAHSYKEQDFPIIFHYNIVKQANSHDDWAHWHESIELLYFIKGRGKVACGLSSVEAGEGDLVIINSNELHYILALTEGVEYYCLIVDSRIYEDFSFNIDAVAFNNIIYRDAKVSCIFNTIIEEMTLKKLGFKSAVKANILNIIVHLARYYIAENYSLEEVNKRDKKIRLVKEALDYIRNNYAQNISVDEVCKHVGFSKFYFSRIFKVVTNKTVIEYLNAYRCQKAQRLLNSGKYNVIESAELSGFNNIPYFCRVYKKHYGYSPSKDKKVT